MSSLKSLNTVQINLNLSQLFTTLTTLKNLDEFSFTLPKPDTILKESDLKCFNKLNNLEIDISNDLLLLPYILEYSLNLTNLKIFSINQSKYNYKKDDQVLNFNKLTKLENLFISNAPNLIIDRNILNEKVNILKKYQVNFKQEFKITSEDSNVSFADSLNILSTVAGPIESIEFNFNLLKSNRIQSCETNKFLTFNIDSFAKNLSNKHLKSMVIESMHNSYPTKFFFILNEIDYLKKFMFIENLNLNQIHVHLNYSFCEILSNLKCKFLFLFFKF